MPRSRTAGRSLFGFMLFIALAVLTPAAHASAINYGDFGPDFPPGATTYGCVNPPAARAARQLSRS